MEHEEQLLDVLGGLLFAQGPGRKERREHVLDVFQLVSDIVVVLTVEIGLVPIGVVRIPGR